MFNTRIGGGIAGALAVLVALAAPASSQAQTPPGNYPDKPVKLIVPFAPAGPTDVVARLYSEQLRQNLARSGVFVENKPGASGIIAIEEMARAKPDGHTLLIGNISTNGLTPVLLAKKMKIDYERDVQVITPLADVPVFFLATTTNFPPQTFGEFLVYAKEHPGKVRYGSAGLGLHIQHRHQSSGRQARSRQRARRGNCRTIQLS